jgi:ParB-like chromosome segregation protein Spo0J
VIKLYEYLKIINDAISLLKKNPNFIDEYWSDETNQVTMSDIQKKLKENNIPVIEEPSEKYNSIHSEKTDEDTLLRVEASDLHYPIIIITKDSTGEKIIIDGHHRLKKAKLNNLPIKVRKIDISLLPKEWDNIFF